MSRRLRSRRRKLNAAKPYRSPFERVANEGKASPVIRGDVVMASQFASVHTKPSYAIDPRTGIIVRL